jgi:hypothetical protein
MDQDRDRDSTDDADDLVAPGSLNAVKQIDWKKFWELPRPTVSDEVVRDAIAWAKRSAVDDLIDRWISEGRLTGASED